MKKIILSVAALAATISLVEAAPAKKDTSGFSGQVKAMHILDDNTNKFTPENGSGYLLTLKYVTPELVKGLKAGGAFYINGDTSLTRWESSQKKANGMFTDKDGANQTNLGQAYLEYKNNSLFVKAGRQILDTPLTKIKWSLMPNFYEAAVVAYKPTKSLNLTLAHVNRMSYGSRATADFGLIGEATGTAGLAQKPISVGGSFKQAKFHNIGEAAGLDKTDGITALNATYKMGKNLKISLWDYYAHDLANMIYADVAYKMPVMKGTALTLNAQYLNQSETGDNLAGDIDFSLYGAKAKIGNKKWSAFIAYNASNDSDSNRGFVNAWGADPAYTSSLFSRNQYRDNVSAYKIGGHYAIMKGLKLIVSHANYGQSDTIGGASPKWKAMASVTDATETDIIIAYKPTKAWTLKIFNAMRTSEYHGGQAVLKDGSGNTTAPLDREMNQFRVIAAYNF